jgi:hypothetical protein
LPPISDTCTLLLVRLRATLADGSDNWRDRRVVDDEIQVWRDRRRRRRIG